MGIPRFYRWLTKTYPDTLCSVVEDDSCFPPNSSKPNPNGVEFDNLYIDMNGIIHTCFHPEGLPSPPSYDDIFNFISLYIDKVFSIVRPRKLLYLAVDGVAPRAKMNHQRIRRFKAARLARKSCKFGVGREDKIKMDSNVITPGTEFMDLLSCALKFYVQWRVNGDPGWRGIKVILSDSTVVGEGEYKIMSYIRSQRNLPGYDPNTRHCLHGMDADLIMLSLATHEIHVSILREVITYTKKRPGSYSVCMRNLIINQKFEFFNIWVLRECLERDLLPNVEGADLDRVIDDFVFMCFFVGNDFLASLPSLSIFKGIPLLMMVYQQEFVKMGYLTNAPEVNLKSMEHFLQVLSSHLKSRFMKDSQFLKLNMENNKRKREDFHDPVGQLKIVDLDITRAPDTNPDGGFESTTSEAKTPDSDMELTHYTMNFNCKSDDVDRIKRHAVFKYTEGVCWIMHYYYQQVPSWQWFYPYHYAPLASDFVGLDKLDINFTLGQPFKPLDQLLAVLPAASAQALPLFYRELMTRESSPILDFYPEASMKMHDMQGVSKLPFIDESRLLSEIAKVEHTLTDEEKLRNRSGRDMLYVHASLPLATMIKDLPSSDSSSEVEIKIRPDLSNGMNGFLCISDKPVFPSSIPSPLVNKPAIQMNRAKSVDYKCPSYAHIPKLLNGVKMPPRILGCHILPISNVSEFQRPTKKKKQWGQQNVINGTSDAKFVVKWSRNHLIGGKLTNQIVGQQQMKTGNGGVSNETQRDETQVKGTKGEVPQEVKNSVEEPTIYEKPLTGVYRRHESVGGEPNQKPEMEKLEGQQVDLLDPEVKHTVKSVENVEKSTICEKPVTGDGQLESLGGEPIRKLKKKKKKLETLQVDLVDTRVEADKTVVNSVEESTIATKSSDNHQEHSVALEHKNTMHVKDETTLINGEAGENKMELVITNVDVGDKNLTKNKFEEPTIYEKPLTGWYRRHESVGGDPNLKPEKEKLEGQQVDLLDPEVKHMVKSVEKSTICEKPVTGGDGQLESLGGEPIRKRKKKKKKLETLQVDLVDTVVEADKNVVNSVEESTIGTKSSDNHQEYSVELEHKNTIHVKDETTLINGEAGENKMELVVTNVDVGDKNLTKNKFEPTIYEKPLTGGYRRHESVGGDPNRKPEKEKLEGEQVDLLDPEVKHTVKSVENVEKSTICEKPVTGGDGQLESLGGEPIRKLKKKKKKLETLQVDKNVVNSVEESTIGTKSSDNHQEHSVALEHKNTIHVKGETTLINEEAGENKMEPVVTNVEVGDKNQTKKKHGQAGVKKTKKAIENDSRASEKESDILPNSSGQEKGTSKLEDDVIEALYLISQNQSMVQETTENGGKIRRKKRRRQNQVLVEQQP
ncbi:hypothetical protein R6Q59_005800 [Mikania micrantha]